MDRERLGRLPGSVFGDPELKYRHLEFGKTEE